MRRVCETTYTACKLLERVREGVLHVLRHPCTLLAPQRSIETYFLSSLQHWELSYPP